MLFFVLKTDFAWAKGQWKNIMATLVLASCCETKWSPIWKIRGTPKCNFEVSSLGLHFCKSAIGRQNVPASTTTRQRADNPSYIFDFSLHINIFFSSFNSFFYSQCIHCTLALFIKIKVCAQWNVPAKYFKRKGKSEDAKNEKN